MTRKSCAVILLLVWLAGTAAAQEGTPLRDALLPTGCDQACYLGIRPGLLPIDQVDDLLDEAQRVYEYRPGSDDPDRDYYLFDIQAADFPFATPETRALITVFTELDSVFRVTIAPLQGLTLAHVFDEFGTPVQIVRRGDEIELVYDNYLLAFVLAADLEHVASLKILSPSTPRAYPTFSGALQPCTEPASLCGITLLQRPVAAAGADLTLIDADDNGSELVTLDGAASTDPDGTLVTYHWLKNDGSIASGVAPEIELTIGRHVLTLTVTDNDGLTASDEVIIRVEPGVSEEVLAARRHFFYSYIDRTGDDEQDVLYLVDPRQPEAEPRAIPLPIPTDKYLVAAEASPTGEWLYLLSSESWGMKALLQLYNLSTHETRTIITPSEIHIAEGYNDPIPVWSPDGNYLAFIAYTGTHRAYLYSVEDDEIEAMYSGGFIGEGGPIIEPYKLSWLPDGSAIVAFEVSCSQARFQRCTFDFWVMSVPDGALLSETSTPLETSWISDLAWSPDGRRAVFHYQFGDPRFIDIELSDVLMWDRTTGSVTPLTHFSNPFPMEERPDRLSYVNQFTMHWFDADRLLLSYNTNTITWDADMPFQPGSFRLQADVVTFPAELATPIFPEFIEEWASNPVTGETAFMSTVYALNENGSSQYQDRNVRLAIFDGQDFGDMLLLPDGFKLAWSPDGTTLGYAYLAYDTPAPYAEAGLVFVDQADKTVRIIPAFADTVLIVGWVAIDEWPTGDAAE